MKKENHYFIYLLLTFIVNMKQKQTNAISSSHYVSSLAYVSRSCQHFQRNQKKRNRPAFQEFFDQQFGRLDTRPLTKQPRFMQTTFFLTPPPLNKPPHPQEDRCPDLLLTQEPVPN